MLFRIVKLKINNLQVLISENLKIPDQNYFPHVLENITKKKKNLKIIHFAKETGFQILIKVLK